jgi:hypothetical protein
MFNQPPIYLENICHLFERSAKMAQRCELASDKRAVCCAAQRKVFCIISFVALLITISFYSYINFHFPSKWWVL